MLHTTAPTLTTVERLGSLINSQCQAFRKYLDNTEPVVILLLDSCDKLCDLRTSQEEFDLMMMTHFKKDDGDKMMTMRLEANVHIEILQTKLSDYAFDAEEQLKKNRWPTYRHIRRWGGQEINDQYPPDELRNFLSQCKDYGVDIYLEIVAKLLYYMNDCPKREEIRQEIISYNIAYPKLCRFSIEKTNKTFEAKVCIYEEWRKSTQDEHDRVKRELKSSLHGPKNETVLNLLEKMHTHYAKRYDQLNCLCAFYIEGLSKERFEFYNAKYKNTRLERDKYNQAIKVARTFIVETRVRLLYEKLTSKEDRCILTQESIRDTSHGTRTECLFVVATNRHVHHRTLCNISLLCKSAYYAVYRACHTRLIVDGGFFHPLFFQKWEYETSPNVFIDTTRILSKKRKACSVVASLSQEGSVWLMCEAEVTESLLHHHTSRAQPHMTISNRKALSAFGLPAFYCDILYSLQLRYHHLYFEFSGEGQEKASQLFNHNDQERCRFFFMVDGACYCLQFIVKDAD